MQVPELIRKKRDGGKLSSDDIKELIGGYVDGRIPDYQVAAFLMAVFFRGMDREEIQYLIGTMVRSGHALDLDSINGTKIDKHSTGGVGDKTSLVVAPTVAACGVYVPMISGRGLGFSGGTLDKLESIPGFKVDLPVSEIQDIVSQHGFVFVGQTHELVPADKLLYALRDVTSTIESVPLIVASIMSKKLAEGVDGLVLDVKTGIGSFMKTLERSTELAQVMVDIGGHMGKKVVALVTSMDQPLGHMVGNALEVREALDTLQGEGPQDFNSLCRSLTAHMLFLGEAATSLEEGLLAYDKAISSGHALEKFRRIIERQGGDPHITEEKDRMPQASGRITVTAPKGGYVSRVDAARIGMAGVLLGTGRQTVDGSIDPAVGIEVPIKIGDEIESTEPLCTLYYNRDTHLEEALGLCRSAVKISEEAPNPEVLVRRVIQ